jgi:hypothetical protein
MLREDKILLYENSFLSFKFDFFSQIDRLKLAKHLSKYLNINVKVNEYYNSDTLTESVRLCRNDFGGSKMNQIQTAFMPYNEAINIAFRIFDFIDYYGYTNSKCKSITSIKMNADRINTPKISQINTLKLISSIDEINISEKWYKNRKDRTYLESLMYIYPKSIKLNNFKTNEFIDYRNFKYPSSPNFNINFDDIKNETVTIKFTKYKDYQKQKRTFNVHINETISKIFSVLKNNNSLTINENAKISRVMNTQYNILKSIWEYDDLCKNHKNIKLYVDLKEDKSVISVKYPYIRTKLFELMSYCGVDSARVNYDTERNSLQVCDAKIYNGHHISDIEFFNSTINGIVKNCSFYECNITNSKLNDCKLYYGTVVKNSKVFETKFHGVEISLFNSFINNSNDLLIEASLHNCVVVGVVNYTSYIDENSEIIKILKK